jgi:hypothetical protein
MKKLILTIALLAFTTTTVLAGGYGYGPRGGYNGYNGYRGGNGWNYGAAALGGAIIGGALVYGATRPYYSAPAPVYVEPPVYYAPPPVYYSPPVNTAPYSPAPVLYWDANCQCYR